MQPSAPRRSYEHKRMHSLPTRVPFPTSTLVVLTRPCSAVVHSFGELFGEGWTFARANQQVYGAGSTDGNTSLKVVQRIKNSNTTNSRGSVSHTNTLLFVLGFQRLPTDHVRRCLFRMLSKHDTAISELPQITPKDLSNIDTAVAGTVQ